MPEEVAGVLPGCPRSHPKADCQRPIPMPGAREEVLVAPEVLAQVTGALPVPAVSRSYRSSDRTRYPAEWGFRIPCMGENPVRAASSPPRLFSYYYRTGGRTWYSRAPRSRTVCMCSSRMWKPVDRLVPPREVLPWNNRRPRPRLHNPHRPRPLPFS